MDRLAVIMPVYNEEEIIETVLNDWLCELDKLKIDYKMFVYNDGSKDNSANIIASVAKKNSNLIFINQQNMWHGPTILKGYKNAVSDFNWIFQVDSDNEMGPESFHKLWEQRNNFDFLIVIREGRLQSSIRKFISIMSRLCIRFFYGKGGPWDVNSPYRLMRVEKFKDTFDKLPENTLSPNMILSGIAAGKKMRIFECPVPCNVRKTGKALNSIKLLKTSVKSFRQTMVLSRLL